MLWCVGHYVTVSRCAVVEVRSLSLSWQLALMKISRLVFWQNAGAVCLANGGGGIGDT
jgi:hypothetical protein